MQTTHLCKMWTHLCCIYANLHLGQINAIKTDAMTLFLMLNPNANGASTKQRKNGASTNQRIHRKLHNSCYIFKGFVVKCTENYYILKVTHNEMYFNIYIYIYIYIYISVNLSLGFCSSKCC
jgi:hypothetical protein